MPSALQDFLLIEYFYFRRSVIGVLDGMKNFADEISYEITLDIDISNNHIIEAQFLINKEPSMFLLFIFSLIIIIFI